MFLSLAGELFARTRKKACTRKELVFGRKLYQVVKL